MATDPAAEDPPARPPPRWPTVIGTIGVVLGVVMLIDKADDLALVPLIWAGDSRNLLLGPELSTLVALGLLLVIASLRLRSRRRSGVALCRAWAWLSIGWWAAGAAGLLWWLGKYGGEVAKYAEAGWERSALVGGFASLAMLLVYPVFLLVWFSRAAVKEEYLSWRK